MKTQISVLINKAALLIMLLSASILMPFNIYADTATVLGTEVSLISTNTLSEKVYDPTDPPIINYFTQFIYRVHVELDNNYFGYMTVSLPVSYYSRPENTITTNNTTFNRKVFINGSSFEFNIEITSYYSIDPLLRNAVNGTPSVTVLDQSVTLISDLDSIQQIIDVLNDLYNSNDQVEGLLNNQLIQLQEVVSNTSLANQYLETLTKMREFDVYTESLPWSIYLVNNRYNRLDSANTNNYYLNYPIFNMLNNDQIWRNVDLGTAQNQYIHFIFLSIDWISQNDANNLFSNQNLSLARYDRKEHSKPYFIYHLVYNSSVANNSFILTRNVQSLIPIYIFVDNNPNNDTFRISTDFALQFGLKNDLLNNIETITNGTSASNQQSSDLSSGTDSMQDQMDDLVGVEDSYNQQFNNSVNSIDFSNPLQQNQGLLGASNFVITVFNGLIANNPFSILIIIVCILLIGKKVIGK